MHEYKVGQILFLIGDKSMKIMPIQIVEEVVRTTIDGSMKTYTVQLPDDEKTQADISSVKGTLFKTTSLLRAHMLKNATNAIDTMIKNATKISEKMFDDIPDSHEQQEVLFETKDVEHAVKENQIDKVVQINDEEDIIKVDLGNGKFGNLNLGGLKAQ